MNSNTSVTHACFILDDLYELKPHALGEDHVIPNAPCDYDLISATKPFYESSWNSI